MTTLLQLLPEGFELPPLPYLLALVLAGVAVAVGFARHRPPVTPRHTLAAIPWIVTGAAAHVLFVVDWVPELGRPLLGTPAVYVSVGLLAGAVWLAALGRANDVPRTLTLTGAGTATLATAGVVSYGLTAGRLAPTLPVVGLLVGATLGVLTARLLASLREDVATAGQAATLAVAAHGIDGVTTAVGVDLLGFGERTPLSAAVLDFAAALPTAELLGAGWLFVLVKLAVSAVAVAAIAPAARETPTEGYALLALVAAVGLGPGVHNALLFAVAA